MEKFDKYGIDCVDGMAAFNKHKDPDKETKKRLKKNGSLSDYINGIKENPPEKFKEEDLHIDFYKMLSR